jgi:hypothetical protein
MIIIHSNINRLLVITLAYIQVNFLNPRSNKRLDYKEEHSKGLK